jgi:hypothetical protein
MEEPDEIPDDDSAREIVTRPPSLHGEPAYELEYIKAMINVAQDDVRHVFVFATVALGFAALFVTQFPIDTVLALPATVRIVVSAGLVALAFAALSFFRYARAIHLIRMRMIRCIPTLDVVRVRELWAGSQGGWRRNRHAFKRAQQSLALGIGCVGGALVYLLIVDSLLQTLGVSLP